MPETRISRTPPALAANDEVQLADIIGYMRQQLLESELRRLRDGARDIFAVETLEIELKVALKDTIGAGGKLDLKFFAITADSEVEAERTHTVRLKLRSVEPGTRSEQRRTPTGLHPSVKARRPNAPTR